MIWNYLHYKNKASPLRQLPRPAPFPLHGSPLRRAACAMLTVASSEPHVPLTLRRPGVMHVVLNNISNSFLGLKITGLKLTNLGHYL